MKAMARIYVWLGCVALLAIPARDAGANPQIDALFSQYDKPGVPGAAVTVIQDGKVLHQNAYGLAERETASKATTKTNYRLASVTKQFTAMAILILVDRGLLRLDNTLTEVFPDFPAYGKQIKISHLLNHTGGLRDYEGLIPSSQTEQVKDRDVLALLQKQSSGLFSPGSRYQYSNSGYCVLGQVVEAVSGESFAAFLKTNIFDVLGMRETVAYEKGISTVSNRAYGYTGSGTSFQQTDQSITSATLGDGGIYTSVEELFLWDQALYGDKLVSAELRNLMFTPGTLTSGATVKYGFGWVLDNYQGMKRQSHTGSTIGFRTSIIRFPEKRFTVAVLINRAGSEPWSIGQRIADLLLF